MELIVEKQDLALFDTGGGLREIKVKVIVDSTLSPRLQRQAVIYEVLATLLSPPFSHETISELTDILGDGLDQLGD